MVKCLPMNDTLFIAKLSSCKLLPGDTNNQLETLPTPGKKAHYLLNHVIKPALDTDDTSSFHNLLYVMEHCGYDHVRKLACEIKLQITKANGIESSTYVYSHMCIYMHNCIPYCAKLIIGI